jgi:hypothetical protein
MRSRQTAAIHLDLKLRSNGIEDGGRSKVGRKAA